MIELRAYVYGAGSRYSDLLWQGPATDIHGVEFYPGVTIAGGCGWSRVVLVAEEGGNVLGRSSFDADARVFAGDCLRQCLGHVATCSSTAEARDVAEALASLAALRQKEAQ